MKKKYLFIFIMLASFVANINAQQNDNGDIIWIETTDKNVPPSPRKTISSETFDMQLRACGGVLLGDAALLISKNGNQANSLNLSETVFPFIKLDGMFRVKQIRFGLGVLSAIPIQAGSVEESTAGKTIYNGDSKLDSHYTLSAFAGYQIDVGKLAFTPMLGLSYNYRKWYAIDGVGENNKAFSGTLLSFAESVWYPSVGADIRYAVSNSVDIDFGGNVYPYLNMDTQENHYGSTNIQSFGVMQGGFGGDAFFSVEYTKPESSLTCLLRVTYTGMQSAQGSYSAGTIGQNASVSTDSSYKTDFKSNLLSVSIGLSLRL